MWSNTYRMSNTLAYIGRILYSMESLTIKPPQRWLASHAGWWRWWPSQMRQGVMMEDLGHWVRVRNMEAAWVRTQLRLHSSWGVELFSIAYLKSTTMYNNKCNKCVYYADSYIYIKITWQASIRKRPLHLASFDCIWPCLPHVQRVTKREPRSWVAYFLTLVRYLAAFVQEESFCTNQVH